MLKLIYDPLQGRIVCTTEHFIEAKMIIGYSKTNTDAHRSK
jgi:hypothetical protein